MTETLNVYWGTNLAGQLRQGETGNLGVEVRQL